MSARAMFSFRLAAPIDDRAVPACFDEEPMRTSFPSKFVLIVIAILLTGGLTSATLPAPVPPAEWVKVKGRVVFTKKQDIPPRIEVKTKYGVRDPDTCLSKGKLYFDDVLIHPENRGIKNAVVFLRPDTENRTDPFPRDRIHPKGEKPDAKTHAITVECCQFEPRVLAVRGGDQVTFKNASAIAHNANYQPPPDIVEGFNVLLPPGKEYTSGALAASRSPSQYVCNIHPWMKGYVWTFDHPYFAVTAADGSFTMPDAPVGKWRVVVWHEKVGYRNWQVKPLGELVTLADDGKAQHDLGSLEFGSDAWVEKKD